MGTLEEVPESEIVIYQVTTELLNCTPKDSVHRKVMLEGALKLVNINLCI